jgi:uncharacterized protein (DUF433 family)
VQLPDFLTEDADGFTHLRGHRIGLLHVVQCYNEGYSPEMLAEEFPTLSLALIHKTIAFYLENQAEAEPGDLQLISRGVPVARQERLEPAPCQGKRGGPARQHLQRDDPPGAA